MKKLRPVVFLAIAIMLGGCSSDATPASVTVDTVSVAVQTSTPRRTDIRREISYSGQIHAQDSAAIVSRLAGRVQSVYFDVGDRVNAGDVLFRLDTSDIEDQIRQLNSQLRLSETGVNSAQAGLDLVTGGQTQSQILQMQGSVDSQQMQIDNARITIENALKQAENARINVEASERQAENARINVDASIRQSENARIVVDTSTRQAENAQIAVDASIRQSELSAIQLSNAQNALDNIETTYNNIRILFEAGVATRNQMEELELARNQTLAGVEQAQIAYDQSLATIEQAQIAHAQSLAAIEQAEIGYDQSLATIAQAEINHQQALAAVEQAQIVHAQALASVDQAQIGYGGAHLGLQQAQAGLNIMQGTIVAENQRSAMLGIEQAMASREAVAIQMDIAQGALDDAVVVAPMAGIVSARNISAGDLISSQIAAYTLVDTDSVLMELRVAENIINQMYVGKEANVIIRTIQDEAFSGVISRINPVADHTSMFPISIEINNPSGIIRPGMFAETSFVREQSLNTLVLDRSVVLSDENSTYVYIHENGTAVRRDVVTGIDNGQEIEILEGLTDTDEVIVRGHNFVRHGESVNIVN